MAENTATWSLSLDTSCPKCRHYFDMLDDGEFFSSNEIEAIEHGTDKTKNMEAVCPECEHEFLVNLEC